VRAGRLRLKWLKDVVNNKRAESEEMEVKSKQ
jgi:hypothetical protein